MLEVGVGFMDEARDAAAREYGARHYRSFAAIALLGKAGPAIAAAVVVAGVLLGAAGLATHWDAIWTEAGPRAAAVLWWVAGGLAGAALLAVAVVVYRRNSWRWKAF